MATTQPFLPRFPRTFPTFSTIPFNLTNIKAMNLAPLKRGHLSTSHANSRLQKSTFHYRQHLGLQIGERSDLARVATMHPYPTLIRRVTNAIGEGTRTTFPIVINTRPHSGEASFLLLIANRLPNIRLELQTAVTQETKLRSRHPRLLPTLFFLSFTLLMMATSLAEIIVIPTKIQCFLRRSFGETTYGVRSRSSMSSSRNKMSSSSNSSTVSSDSPSSCSRWSSSGSKTSYFNLWVLG